MSMKVAIALAYYKRPKIVLNALNSIKELNYDNWHLFFIDDSGDESFRSVLSNFGLPKEKYTYVPILDSDEKKISQGGSRHGHFINNVYYDENYDIGVTLCDDDALFPNYLNDLDKFYTKNKDCHWTYCKVLFYNPNIESYKDSTFDPKNKTLNTWTLNYHTTDIAPSCKVDGAQVSFRLSTFRKLNIKYPSPQTRDCDRSVFEQLQYYLGATCKNLNAFGQYKGWFEDQLGYRHKMTNTDYLSDTSWEKEYLSWIDNSKNNQ